MTERARAEVTKELIRAQDALQSAFQVAWQNNDLDLAKDLREHRKKLGERITMVNGSPVKVSKAELVGAFRS